MVHVAAHWQLLRTVDSESHKQSGWAGGRASERVTDQRGRTDGQQIQRGRVCVQHLQRGGQLHQRGQARGQQRGRTRCVSHAVVLSRSRASSTPTARLRALGSARWAQGWSPAGLRAASLPCSTVGCTPLRNSSGQASAGPPQRTPLRNSSGKASEVSTVVSRYRRTEFVHLFNESGACLKMQQVPVEPTRCSQRRGRRST